MQGAGDLAGPAADAFDHLAFEDFPPLVEAVLEGAVSHDVVERQDLPRQ